MRRIRIHLSEKALSSSIAFASIGAEEQLRTLQSSAGSWRAQRIDGAFYVDRVRGGDLGARLAGFGIR